MHFLFEEKGKLAATGEMPSRWTRSRRSRRRRKRRRSRRRKKKRCHHGAIRWFYALELHPLDVSRRRRGKGHEEDGMREANEG